jgi:LPPG:FO 2-phospho-L-lactate transferase
MSITDRVVLLVGGVGGAKLALGMARVLPTAALTIIGNTGDDFEHLGLHVSPDLDTVMYTLAGLANPETGWGLAGDSFRAMQMVERCGGPAWFRLGDGDLGTNLMRTALLHEGHTLTEVTGRLCAALGVEHALLPMSDDPVRTVLDTDRGTLAFQEYFVRERWEPAVRRIRFEGAAEARPSAVVIAALEQATAIVIGPSNPFLSIDPILAVRGIREQIAEADAPCVAVSPVIGGRAVKGPTVKLMAELGLELTALGVAQHYHNLLDGIILDEEDIALVGAVRASGVRATTEHTLMATLEDKTNLARAILRWLEDNLS